MGRNVIATLLLLWMVSGHSFGQRVVCGIEQGRIAHMVRPEYPAAAKTAGIQGRVVLRALVDKKGQIQK
ncbi:MAG: energy transducer TonB, partial [Burkholderiales bacterium]